MSTITATKPSRKSARATKSTEPSTNLDAPIPLRPVAAAPKFFVAAPSVEDESAERVVLRERKFVGGRKMYEHTIGELVAITLGADMHGTGALGLARGTLDAIADELDLLFMAMETVGDDRFLDDVHRIRRRAVAALELSGRIEHASKAVAS
jgi:hypothetical protein